MKPVPIVTAKTTNVAVVALAMLLLAAAPSGDEKRISIYSAVASYTLPVVERSGSEYVGLLEVLEPLGRVSANFEGRRWKLRFNNIESEFVAGRLRGKIRDRDVDLSVPFLIENSRGLVPIASLSALLPRFLGNPVSLHENARRLFIGDAGTQVSAQLDSSTPPHLILNFTAPVNPTIGTEPGKLRMVFNREPLILPGNPTLSFNNPVISQAIFSESNGAAELTIVSSAPLMANFSNNGRTITISAASAPAFQPQQPAGSSEQTSVPSGGTSPSVSQASRLLVVVDPAHGGTERGAALTDTLPEETVTLGFARLLRHELEQQGFAVTLLREGDNLLSLDQRASTVNASNAVLYITLHASSQGEGVRIYTALLPALIPAQGAFRSWDTAQAASLPLSQDVASAIVRAFGKHEISARSYAASLRPLNNLLVPALAAELAPGRNGISDLPSANYQQKVAAGIADGIASIRTRLGERR